MTLQIGDKATRQLVVEPQHFACNVGSGSVEVLATPMVAALMEGAAADLVQGHLEEGTTTVGSQIIVNHTSPTAGGMIVHAEATLVEANGRMFRFNLRAWDDAGDIANGTHTRVIVKTEGFRQKAEERKERA